MTEFNDLSGQTFGRLYVLERVGTERGNGPTFRCRCSCGNEKVTTGKRLRAGKCKSCGCYGREAVSFASLKRLRKSRGAFYNGSEPIDQMIDELDDI